MNLPHSRKHRLLALAMLLAAAVCALCWIVVVRPQRVRVREGLDAVAQGRRSLAQRGWSARREDLEQLLQARLRVLEGEGPRKPGLRPRAEAVREHATAQFQERLRSRYKSPESFVRNATNIDFREAFNGLQRRLAGEGIWLAPKLLGLAEDSSHPYTYQMLLQVWTLERLFDRVLASHLRVVTDPAVQVRTPQGDKAAARVALQPVVAYLLDGDAQTPDLLGIPVRIRVAGELAEVREFIVSLTAEDEFLPPAGLELFARAPDGEPGDAAEAGGGRVELDLTCCAFFAFPGPGTSASASPRGPVRGAPGAGSPAPATTSGEEAIP